MKQCFRLLIFAVLAVLTVGQASAAPGPYGRNYYDGYFSGVPVSSVGWVFVSTGATPYTGITSNWSDPVAGRMDLAKFLNGVEVRLGDTTSLVNQGRAAAVIDIMLGKNGPDFGGSVAAGIAYAQTHLAQWVSLVTFYDTNTVTNAVPGYSVDWNTTLDFSNFRVDGMGDNSGGVENPDISFIDNFDDPIFDEAMVFHSPGNPDFIVKKKCVNLVGDLAGLAQPPAAYRITPGISSSAGILTPGQTYSFSATAQNAGLATQPYLMTISQQPPVLGVSVGAVATPTWGMPSLGANSATFQPFSITIPATAAPGSHLCLLNTVDPGNDGGTPELSDTVCWDVAIVRNPQILAQSGDVHAGGGVGANCAPTAPGNIIGNTAAPSSDEYVVSATGGIGSFTSNGTGADSLRLGQSGGYAVICRPDLLTAAMDYDNAGLATPWSNGIVNLNNIMAGTAEVYVVRAGDVTLSCPGGCTITRKVTLVLEGGSLTIASPITITSSQYAPHDAPSLGIITAQDINILPGVTRVDAYMFSSQGRIDTCYSVARNVECSNNRLLVNGFLMAHTLSFNRLGPSGSGGSQISEIIYLTPQIYLNPPKLFDSAADSLPLQGEGERPPLY